MIKPGLERISRLLKDVALPWKPIHVAGTNGKGSICAYISAMLRGLEVRTGRFTSPHLIDRWDCIRIDEKPIDASLFRQVENEIQKRNDEEAIEASSFEMLTAIAFEVFSRERVQVGVVECGMGGRLDATNVIQNPLVTIIASISKDHEAMLGDSLESIALHKAGIIKAGSPCVVAATNKGIIKDTIDGYAANLRVKPFYPPFPLLSNQEKHHSQHQNRHERAFSRQIYVHARDYPFQDKINMSCAYYGMLLAMPELRRICNIPAHTDAEFFDRVRQGLNPTLIQKTLPGRLQYISIESLTGRKSPVLIDGAHNIAAWEQLRDHVSNKLRPASSNVTWLLAASGVKSPIDMMSILTKNNDHVVSVEFGPVDGMPWVQPKPPTDFVEASSHLKGLSAVSCGKDVMKALRLASDMANEGPLTIAGSLYLVSDVFRHLRDSG